MSAPVPPTVVEAAMALGAPTATLAPLGGATGQTWNAGDHVLRLGDAASLDREQVAAVAASSVVPVPEVLDRVDLAATSAVLLRRLPGRPAADLDGTDPATARRRGLACGRVHDALAGVVAPASVRRLGEGGDRLLHLDLHPFNVLVDDGGEVMGVLDWANAAAGDPALDRARTSTILRLDPSAVRFAGDEPWQALVSGWSETGRFAELEPSAVAWACRFMLADLAHRYEPHELGAATAALQDAERI